MNNQIENIISYFEKLFGITLTEINSGDFSEALNSLIGIEKLLLLGSTVGYKKNKINFSKKRT